MSNAIQQTIAILDNLEGGQFLEEIIVYLENLIKDIPKTNYMVGQRIIYGNVICTVIPPPEGNVDDMFWIYNPEKKHEHWVAICNIAPLPNGQL